MLYHYELASYQSSGTESQNYESMQAHHADNYFGKCGHFKDNWRYNIVDTFLYLEKDWAFLI